MIPRLLHNSMLSKMFSLRKIILLLGARQVGKTTLLKGIQSELEKSGKRTRFINCDILEQMTAIDTTSLAQLDQIASGVDVIFIDEAQRLSNPGLTLKILYDNHPALFIFASGSSSFELSNKVSEPLTGRYIDFYLFPFSMHEILQTSRDGHDPVYRKSIADSFIENLLKYGSYPEIFLEPDPSNKALLLNKLVESYLFKDILSYQRIRHSQSVIDLARALAYQIGSEVNENELSRRLKIDRKTVVSYLDILEKSFVVKRLFPFSRNPRREIGKQAKLYFTDLGIRNALINNFTKTDLRHDRGALWENFLIIERMKSFANQGMTKISHFWRSYNGGEVDYVEVEGGKLHAFEIKSNSLSLSRGAESFSTVYATPVKLINQKNYPEFINL